MDGEVHPHALGEEGVVEADHGRVVLGPVLGGVDGAGGLALAVQVVVDGRRHHGELGDQIEGVLQRGLENGRKGVEGNHKRTQWADGFTMGFRMGLKVTSPERSYNVGRYIMGTSFGIKTTRFGRK